MSCSLHIQVAFSVICLKCERIFCLACVDYNFYYVFKGTGLNTAKTHTQYPHIKQRHTNLTKPPVTPYLSKMPACETLIS